MGRKYKFQKISVLNFCIAILTVNLGGEIRKTLSDLSVFSMSLAREMLNVSLYIYALKPNKTYTTLVLSIKSRRDKEQTKQFISFGTILIELQQ